MVSLFLLTHANPLTASTMLSKANNSLNYNEAQKLGNRLREIKSMDIKKMTRAEKNDLRTEVISIGEKYRSAGPVVVISVGALVLIVVLLILLL